jgi:four helix bundle protein
VARDFKFRDQIRDSSASVTHNIAEGFGRYGPAEFARFLNIARGSLTETHSSLRDGLDRGYFTPADVDRLQHLAGRAAKATTGLIRYLDSCVREGRRRPAVPSPNFLNPLNPLNPAGVSARRQMAA